MQADEWQSREETLEGWPVRIQSYRLGERWACRVDNVDPGAVIARGEGSSRANAESEAIDGAARLLRTTRRLRVLEERARELAADMEALRREVLGNN